MRDEMMKWLPKEQLKRVGAYIGMWWVEKSKIMFSEMGQEMCQNRVVGESLFENV